MKFAVNTGVKNRNYKRPAEGAIVEQLWSTFGAFLIVTEPDGSAHKSNREIC
jgi:hypothetical protein